MKTTIHPFTTFCILFILLALAAMLIAGCDEVQPQDITIQEPIADDPDNSQPRRGFEIRITGIVRDANGNPVAARVYTKPDGGSIFTPAGNFTFDLAIKVATYTVIAETPDGRAAGEAIVLTAKGNQRADIIVRPSPEVGFSVTVLDMNRNPIPLAIVRLAGDLVSVLTNADGVAILKGGDFIQGRVYEIVVEHPAYQPRRLGGKALAGLTPVVVTLEAQ